MKKYSSKSLTCFILLLILCSPSVLKSMEEHCDACRAHKKADQNFKKLFATFRSDMCTNIPMKHYMLEGVEEEKIPLFKKKEVKERGLLPFFNDDPETAKLFLTHVFYKTLQAFTLKKIEQHYLHIPLESSTVKNIVKDYFVELFFQKFHKPAKERSFLTCTCAKATLYDKIGCTLTVLAKLPSLLPPEQCTPHQPLSGIFFGSGLLLSEYLLSYILAKQGYPYQRLHFVDRKYCNSNTCKSLFKEFQDTLQSNGCKAECNVFPDSKRMYNFIRHTNTTNHLVISIDPGDYEEINEQNIVSEASEVHISFLNHYFNRHQNIIIQFSDMTSIKIENSKNSIDESKNSLETQKMMKQSSHFREQIHTTLALYQQDRDNFINALFSLLNKKEEKFKKHKDNTVGYNVTNATWFANPVKDAENFMRAVRTTHTHTPPPLALMVYYGVQEFDGNEFH